MRVGEGGVTIIKMRSFLAIITLFMALTFAMVTLQASATDGPAVAILSVMPDTDKACVGKTVSINVTVQNDGDANGTFTVYAYFGNATGNYTIGTLSTPELSPGENTTLTFHWDTTNVKPCQNYRIKANCTFEDPTPENNELVDGLVKINIFADINGDETVDGKDVAESIKAFGASSGHPRWNPYIDLNNDGKCDIKDIALILKNFGKTCS